MKPLYHHQYITKIFEQRDAQALYELHRILVGAKADREAPGYGLSAPLLLLFEGTYWFGCVGGRCTTRTYFGGTPDARRQAMLSALRAHTPPHFGATYAQGMREFVYLEENDPDDKKEEASDRLDSWMEQHEDEFNEVLWQLLERERPVIEAILCDP